MEVNRCQTEITEDLLQHLNPEVREQFIDIINNIPFVKSLVAPSRKYARDLPRDEEGKIIVDITKPHILEDMDYFRPMAIRYQKYGNYTTLRPNKNPNSEYGKWIREEVRRCYYGYVRPTDGEWITGDYYFFLNYCPMLVSKKSKDGKYSKRVIDFPSVWEGHYYKFHYLLQARMNGKHATELASRSKGKSFCAASMLARRFILGEAPDVNTKVVSYIVAFDKSKLVGGDQTLDKFQYDIDFCATNTQFPNKRLINTIQNMQWQMGYIDLDTGAKKGTLNAVVGKSYNDSSKLRGSRGVLYLFEEAGSFSNLLDSYNNLRPSVEEGNEVFGMLYLFGTAGDDQSDFSAMQEIMYNPKGYNVYGIPNVYDKEGLGRKQFTFFFPGYLNRAGCYDNNGNSDVVKALIEILEDRYTVKYNSTDINSITKRIAEIPITPQEAILRSHNNLFPVIEINNRINEIDNNPSFYDDTYVGTLVLNSNTGEVEFMPTSDKPIREFPLKDNKASGAIEIFEMPAKVQDKVPSERYILSLDNYENDEAQSMSLGSIFVLDLWTDRIVAEYTGRPTFADDLNEIARKMCLFYNGKLLYEANKKNTFAYFSRLNSLHLLADTPEYLRQKQIVKTSGFGNSSKGVVGTVPVFNFAYTLIRDWLLKPVTMEKEENGQPVQYTLPNLYFIKNRALLKELALFNPDINVDRVKSLCQLMLYREEKMIIYQGNPQNYDRSKANNTLANDPFFSKNYDSKFSTLDKKTLEF